MKLSFRAIVAHYQGRDYKKALLIVDDESRETELQTERGLFKKKMERLVNLGVVTEVATVGNNVTIGDAIIVLESERDAATIAQLFYHPDLTKSLAAAKNSAEKFLRARGSALSVLISLQGDPRGTLLATFEEAPEDVDPVDVLVSNSEKTVKDAIETMRREIEAEAKDLPPETLNRIYAIVYAVGLVQNSYLKLDEPGVTAALGLLSQATQSPHPSLSDLKGMNLDEAAVLLLSLGFNGLNSAKQ